MAADYPSRVEIMAFFPDTVSGVWTRFSVNGYWALNLYSAAGTGNYAGYNCFLKSGTWRLIVFWDGLASNGDPAAAVSLGGTSLGTINQAVEASNQITTFTGIAVASSGLYELRFTASTTKYVRLRHMILQRTGA